MMFIFLQLITDFVLDGGSNTADVSIYLVSSANRVTFVFINILEKVEESVNFVSIVYLHIFMNLITFLFYIPVKEDELLFKKINKLATPVRSLLAP